ncbi:MAG: hypothetical protein QOC77_1522 [Thermoleophilaceae bacterium]|nr:hypothetical protein [Thermoleophilaceae bacterium]
MTGEPSHPPLENQPHARHRHVFVVVRLDRADALARQRPADENDVVLTKAFFSADDARAEVARLNGLERHESLYFFRVGRLVDE